MALSYDLLSQFAKITNDKNTKKKETSTYGTIVKYNNAHYVKLDGSDLLTPYTSTVAVNDGDRVLVTIKNHSATVTGSTSNPSASNKDVVEIGNEITKFEIIVADKVTAQDIEAINAYFESIKAISGQYENLAAITAEIETLQAKYAEMEYISATDVNIINAEIESLKVKFAEFTEITVEDLEAINADFSNIVAYNADFTYVSAEVLEVMKAGIKDLDVNKLDAESASIAFANIDFSNIGEAAITKIFSDSGIIEDLVVSEGKITGELVGVTIKGDVIEGNTIKADKLVVLGEDGLYYKLNVNSLGEAVASSDEKYQNGLDGSVIIAKSITADRVSVTDLVAFDATIGGFNITENSIYSGVKSSVDNTTKGMYMDDDGQVVFGDATNYLKYYKDENGEYKLAISFGNKDLATTVEDVINRTSYITMGKDNEGRPCIELGKREPYTNMIVKLIDGVYTETEEMTDINNGTLVEGVTTDTNLPVYLFTDSEGKQTYYCEVHDETVFKVRITNKAINFLENDVVVAYINNQSLYTEKIVVKNELQIGEGPGFVWKVRENGNMGLIYIE